MNVLRISRKTVSHAAILAGASLLLWVLNPSAGRAEISSINTGSVVFGTDPTCGTATAGAIRYTTTGPNLQWCNGSAWGNLTSTNAGSGTYGATSGVLAKLGDGSAQNPSLTFYSDPTTGLYFTSSYTLNFATAGVQRASINGSGHLNLLSGGFQLAGTTVLEFPNGDSTGLAIGPNALDSQSGTNQHNFAGGYQAGQYVSSGVSNIAFGAQAMTGVSGTPLTGSYNVALGYQAMTALRGTATGNVAIGASAADSMTTGTYNTAIGMQALQSVTTASYNVAIGYQAAYNTTSSYNTVAGYQALFTNTTSPNNTAVGYQALYNATATNTAYGYKAGYSITTGTGNLAMGNLALGGGAALTGNYNVAIGDSALYSQTGTVSNNTAIGYYALYSAAGSNNTAFGYQAGYAGTAVTTGTNNTFVGYLAQANAAAYTNGTALGNAAVLTASNTIKLGNASITAIKSAHTSSFTNPSDRRLKKDINALPDAMGLTFINSLKPSSFRLKDSQDVLRYGFIAQEIAQALPAATQQEIEVADTSHGIALVSREHNDERTYHVVYAELIAPVIKAIQQQQARLKIFRTQIDGQRSVLSDWRKTQNENEAILQEIKVGNDRLKLRVKSRQSALEGKNDKR